MNGICKCGYIRKIPTTKSKDCPFEQPRPKMPLAFS